MTDYYESHYPSREASYSRGDPMDETAIRRTMTRDSHQSHPSISASTRSWVHSNQLNPPPPPDDTTPSPSPARRPPRPLPDPTLRYSQPVYHYGPQEVVREEEHFELHAPTPSALPFGFPTEELGDETPLDLTSPPLPADDRLHPPLRENQSFVGGFFSGLKRLPRILKGGGGGKRLKRKGTFGTDTHTEGTGSTTAMTGGNTLPRYLSNPSIGPSNPQFAHRLSMAVANGSLPPGSSPAVFHVRETQAGPQYPVVTITPASDGPDRITEEQASYYDGPQADPQHRFSGDNDDRGETMPPNLQERTTVMVYNTDSQAPTIMQTPVASIPPRQPTPGPRVSYQAQLPTRANTQSQPEQPSAHGPPIHAPTPVRNPPPILQSPKEVLSSTQATSSYTISAAPSFYDPSYSSSLTPVEKFFKGLYHLPWIAHERITIDYRPADSKRAQDKIRGFKKPMASWYRSIVPRSRRTSRSLDLLSSGTSSPQTSLGNPLTPLASPISRRSGRSSNTNGRSKPKHHRKKRHTVSSSTTGYQIPHRTASPIIPSNYPYAYPGYPYAYPYGPYPTAMPIPTSPRGPRKHKSKRTMKYPYGYAPYQPMAMPSMPSMPSMAPVPPIYFISPSPPQSANGGEGSGDQGSQPLPQAPPPPLPHPPPMQVPPMYMFGSGPLNLNSSMVSPPLTPQKPQAFHS